MIATLGQGGAILSTQDYTAWKIFPKSHIIYQQILY